MWSGWGFCLVFIVLEDIWICLHLTMVLELKDPGFIFLFQSHRRRCREPNFGGVIALQASRPIHLGVDNANVVGHVGRIIAGKLPSPFELLVYGDLLVVVKMLVEARGLELQLSPKSKVMRMKAWLEEEADKVGNDMADEAAASENWGSCD